MSETCPCFIVMYHAYSIASVSVYCIIPVYLEVINRNLVCICSSPSSHNKCR